MIPLFSFGASGSIGCAKAFADAFKPVSYTHLIDSEQEQVLCYDSRIDAEHFASEKCAIFLIIPEEDPTKHFMAGLMIQNLSRELFSIADANEGKLKKRVVFYCDEFGTMPPFDVLPLFSAGRSRKLTLVPIIQSLAQLETVSYTHLDVYKRQVKTVCLLFAEWRSL